ncbi:hypothetical protein TW84_02510 [Vibrio neptunius]|uniref:hypothetical protein n=1 Tax=Vibrio neptunius TaxID=170651 RepID=UPI0005F9FB14|nr:hypothetical protein [Vibrio neptunius]KJY93761.1 hypothetical protein TW84_02510 [Vibrio neptunius]
MKGRSLILMIGVVSSSAGACELYNTGYSSDSVLFHSSRGICFSLLDGIQYTANKLDAFDEWISEERSTDYSSYWADWVLQTETSPILSQSLASNYIGIGVWVPSELEDKINVAETEDWIMSHGLQLSVGFGEKKPGEPRLRLDYRWHDDYERDVIMQLELPF